MDARHRLRSAAGPLGRPLRSLQRPAWSSTTSPIFLKIFLLGFTALVIWLSLLTGIPDREDSADFYCLLLGATLGMSIMASANHLLMVFIGVEMASLPSYALAGFLKGRGRAARRRSNTSSTAAAPRASCSTASACWRANSAPATCPTWLQSSSQWRTLDPDRSLLGHVCSCLIGIGFKLAAVPFHFWCPDVFEGAAAEVAGFLSVASKGAALALLARIALGLAGLTGHRPIPAAWMTVAPVPGAGPRLLCRRDRDLRQPGRLSRRPTSNACWPIRPSPTPAT